MFNSMQEPLAEAHRMRAKSPAINPFLIYFLFLVAGVPLSLFVELMLDPKAQSLEYWNDVNKDAQIPHGTIKSAEQLNERKPLP